MTAMDLWVLGVFQTDTGHEALGVMYHMDINFWLLIGHLAEEEQPDFFTAAVHKYERERAERGD